MQKAHTKKPIALLAMCMSLLMLLTSCAYKAEIRLPVLEDYDMVEAQTERTELKMGVVAGPYGDMFDEIIGPLLGEKGYSVDYEFYGNYTEPNVALANGEIDFNMFQNYMYLNESKVELNVNLSAIAEIPTVPMGIYSAAYSNLEAIADGSVVALPRDNSNFSRALMVLSAAGLITIEQLTDISKITTQNITQNPKNLRFVPVDAHLLAESLAVYDLAVINGNYALSGGLNISDALFREALTDHAYLNVVAVRTEDLSEAFVMDLIAVLDSKSFINAITDANGKYRNYQYPCNFNK